MGEILDVLVDHRETVLGNVSQVIHHAGLAGTARCGEEDMPSLESFPKLGEENIAEHQVGRIHRSAGIKFGTLGTSWHNCSYSA